MDTQVTTLNHLSMMYVTFIICHLIITRILDAELNYRFTNSKTSLAIVIQYSLQEEESRNVSSELVHYNHKVLAIYTHWQTHWHTHTLPHQQSDGNYWAQMIWKDDGNTLTVAHTAHVTWVRHHVTHHTLASFIFKVVSKNKG